MIQSFRENMKNTFVVVFVVIFFIVPMVISGVGGDILGSVAGDDAAKVGREPIPEISLARAMEQYRQRVLTSGEVDSDAEFLQDENLRGPILSQLVQRAALIDSAKRYGMNLDESVVEKEILSQEQFYIDGAFNPQAYRRLLANVRFSPATYKAAIKSDMLIDQLNQGLVLSSFATSSGC